MNPQYYVACDLGAESGRVMLGCLDGQKLELQEIHRFSNGPMRIMGSLRWNTLRIFDELKRGLRKVAERGIEPLMLQPAAELAVSMILEMAGGKLEGGAIVAGKVPYAPITLNVSREFIVNQLGFKVSAQEIEKALTAFGFALTPTPVPSLGEGNNIGAAPCDPIATLGRLFGIHFRAAGAQKHKFAKVEDPEQASQKTCGSKHDITSASKGETNNIKTNMASWSVSVPSFRLDISRPVDLVEEVLRFYGVDRIPAAPLTITANESADAGLYTTVRELSHRLIALGYNECMHYTLRNKADAERYANAAELHAIANPLSADMGYLRSSLIPGLLEALELNRSRGNALAPLFEAGHVFRSLEGKLYELQSIAFLKVISPAAESWRKTEATDFFETKAIIESLLASAGMSFESETWNRIDVSNLWQPGHAATLLVSPFGFPSGDGSGSSTSIPGSRVLPVGAVGVSATAGLVNLEAVKLSGFSGTVLAGEILFTLDAFDKPTPAKRYSPFSLFPNTRRDVAVIVPQEALAGDVEATLKKLALESINAAINKFELEDVNLFDLYQGKGIPEGHKSLAFALTFRAADRTLTDDEVNNVFRELIEKLKKAGYQIRE